MAPIPVANKTPTHDDGENDVGNIESPNFFVTGSDSDSDNEIMNGGYELLPQEPGLIVDSDDDDSDGGVDLELSADVIPATNGGDGSISLLDQAVTSVLGSDDFLASASTGSQFVTSAEEVASPSKSTEMLERRQIWNTDQQPKDSVPMDSEKVCAIRGAMSNFILPVTNQPNWAKLIPEEEWKAALLNKLNIIPSPPTNCGSKGRPDS